MAGRKSRSKEIGRETQKETDVGETDGKEMEIKEADTEETDVSEEDRKEIGIEKLSIKKEEMREAGIEKIEIRKVDMEEPAEKESGRKGVQKDGIGKRKTGKRKAAEEESREDLTIEESFVRLEELLAKMEEGDCSLEQSFQYYEAGMKLVKACHERIDYVEKQIIVLSGEGQEE
ncbi:exodeoxyribonuclease VII small subunit [Lachnospiraceae bacterium 62-35]